MDFRPCCSERPPVGVLPDVCSAAAAITRVGDAGLSPAPAASCSTRHDCRLLLSAGTASWMHQDIPDLPASDPIARSGLNLRARSAPAWQLKVA